MARRTAKPMVAVGSSRYMFGRMELIHSERRANGCREYGDPAMETVRRIRALLAAGPPTRIIRKILPRTSDEAALRPCPGVLADLREQLDVLDRRAADLEAAAA
ncbi:MerR family transcriptional regulator [Streptomyces cucumeris]|uniref:MerR family transcriptional regulator n=1 Tax=Streptomyces cucumeris TaxID=2962890 RepID=UPI003D763670